MLRLGDSIYAMTLMRQDTDVEEDYVRLCVEAGDILDRSQEYANRCGAWADQVKAEVWRLVIELMFACRCSRRLNCRAGFGRRDSSRWRG